MERCSLRDAALRLERPVRLRINETLNTAPHRVDPPVTAPARQSPSRFSRCTTSISDHAYLQSREIHPETATSFGIGMYGGTGLLHGRIVVPIHNERGHP